MFFILALLACEPDPIPESTPLFRTEKQEGGDKVKMTVGPDGLSPISIAELAGIVPELRSRPLEVQQAVAAAVNLVPGPCASCEDRPLAHCMVEPATQCTVGISLVRRALAVADSGAKGDAIKSAVNYPDHWWRKKDWE